MNRALLIVLVATFNAYADNSSEKFRHLEWNTPVPDDFVFQNRMLDSDVYINPNEELQAGEIPLRGVTYFFKQGELHAGEINVDTQHCSLFRKAAFRKYGSPNMQDDWLGVSFWDGEISHIRFVHGVGGCSLHYRSVSDYKEETARLKQQAEQAAEDARQAAALEELRVEEAAAEL